MKAHRGYYSIIQYCPDLSRFEAANVGVLLFCPDLSFLKALTATNNNRIRRFFGKKGHDWKRINVFKRGLEDRLQKESSQIRTIDDLRKFTALRANVMQITDPLPMKVSDADADLHRLYEDIISPETKVRSVSDTKPSKEDLVATLNSSFVTAGVERKVARDITVEVPVLQKKVEIPFGYQNGRFNLISPVQFAAKKPDRSVTKACEYAVEGRSLYETPDPNRGDQQLVVVGAFRSNDTVTANRVRSVFEANEVLLYEMEQVPQLVDEIRRTGRDIAKANGL